MPPETQPPDPRARQTAGGRPGRRVIFIDVENSSRAEHVAAMLAHLDLGTIGPGLRVLAVGNWRVVGQETARLLSARGAQLVHSAPAFGVKDWSDLRIAVAAGTWLGDALPGDMIDIVTDDQAFDAVGDVAASRGVLFRRLSYRALVRSGTLPPSGPRARPHRAGGRRRRFPETRRGR